MTAHVPLLSYSMRANWKSCQRKVFYKYVAKVQPKRIPRPAMIIGRNFHRGLELWRMGRSHEDAMNMALESLHLQLEKETASTPLQILTEGARLQAYLLGYRAKYEASDAKLIGRVAEYKYVDATEIGFIDMLHTDDKGCAWIVEDKTRAIFDANLAQTLPLSEQCLNYGRLLLRSGKRLGGVMYRETKKTRKDLAKGTAKKPTETLDEYRARMIADYTTPDEFGALANFRETVFNFDLDDIEAFSREQAFVDLDISATLAACTTMANYTRNSGECQGKFGPCEYLPLCANLRDPACARNQFEPMNGEPTDGGTFQESIFGTKTPDAPTAPDAPEGTDWWDEGDAD